MNEASFEKRTQELRNPTIKTEGQFWDIFDDSKHQFIALGPKLNQLDEEGFLKENSSMNYLNFQDYLKKSKIVLTGDFVGNKSVQYLETKYNELIERLKNIKSKEEYSEVLEDMSVTLDRFDLGIHKPEEN